MTSCGGLSASGSLVRLASCGRRSPREFSGGGGAPPPLPEDKHLLSAPRGYEVVTSDASGWAGGAWWGHRSLHFAFSEEQLQGSFGSSSNLRELYMVPHTLSVWGHLLRNRRVLFRLDNQASVGAVNKLASMSVAVQPLLLWLVSVLLAHGIHLVARYLPGEDNERADGLSRLKGAVDDQDWQLSSRVFRALASAWGPFAVDACSDPLGRNAYCEVFWSPLDSCLVHDWAGLRVYCNPPFKAVGTVLCHFLACHASAPESTSAVFVLPAWTTESWWRSLAGARVVGYFPAGSSLFTLPDWQLASRRNPVPRKRTSQGPTPWPVLMVLFPPSVSLRFEAAPHRDMPRLRGDSNWDAVLLRGLPLGIVRPVRPAPGHGGPGVVSVPMLRPPRPRSGAVARRARIPSRPPGGAAGKGSRPASWSAPGNEGQPPPMPGESAGVVPAPLWC